MPELPEVEAAARALRSAIVGKTLREVRLHHPAHRRRLSPELLARASNRRVESVARHAKRQFIVLRDGVTLEVHFRMTGDWLIQDDADPTPGFGRASFHFDDGTVVWLIDPRALATVSIREGEAVLHTSVLDATDPGMAPEYLIGAFRRRTGSIKTALLNQAVLGGIGNIYAAEILWSARIDPRRSARSLDVAEVTRVLSATRRVLEKASRASARYAGATASRFNVYDREGRACRRCGSSIRRIKQNGRSTYFCAHCQRPASRTPRERRP